MAHNTSEYLGPTNISVVGRSNSAQTYNQQGKKLLGARAED